MSKEPEKVLEQDRVAAHRLGSPAKRKQRGHEKTGAGEMIEQHHNRCHEQRRKGEQIGRASCRERVCQYVEVLVVAGTLKKTKSNNIDHNGTVPRDKNKKTKKDIL